MSKKLGFLVFCCSLLLVCSVVTPGAFAADVETVGDLKVGGVIESTSGGFKFPDGTTWTTGSMDGLHFNVGFVVDDSNSNAGNLTSGAIKFGTGATGEGIASQRTSGDNQNGLDFYTNSTARLSIANNGYVGVGTRTPTFPLEVRLNRWATYARFGQTSYPLFIIAGMPHVGFNTYYDNGYKYGSTGFAGYLAFNQDVAGAFTFSTAPSGTLDAEATMTTRMVISNSGNVGIGTTTPSQALDVLGNIKASGSATVSGNVSAGAGATHTPLAYGAFNGTTNAKYTGSSNLTCAWVAASSRYECTITGDSFTIYDHIVHVTPTTLAIPRYDSLGGKLVIQFYNTSGTAVQPTLYSVTVYKP